MCGRFEVAQNVQVGEETVQRRKACDMLWLPESHVSERVCERSRRVCNQGQEVCTMDFRFIRSIVAKPLLCARIEVRRNDLGSVDRLLGERSIIKHHDVGARAGRRVA